MCPYFVGVVAESARDTALLGHTPNYRIVPRRVHAFRGAAFCRGLVRRDADRVRSSPGQPHTVTITDPDRQRCHREGSLFHHRRVRPGSAEGHRRRVRVPHAGGDSREGLVDETLEVLDEIRAIDLQAACGDVRPNIDDKDCTSALHKRKLSYWTLETVLDKWSPYIA